MDTSQVAAAKIAASPQDHAWAQAYSTLKLYIVLSVEQTGEKTVAGTGKDILEKLQREFFAQDEKHLETIKKAVENVTSTIEPDTQVSLALATIVNDVLYIVVSGRGAVALSRQGKIAIVAKSDGDALTAFSGKLENGDAIALLTEEFLDKIPLDTLSEILGEEDLTVAAESIAPKLHTDSTGKEAAILLSYVNHAQKPVQDNNAVMQGEETLEEEQDELMGRSTALSFLPSFHVPSLSGLFSRSTFSNKKRLIIIAVIILAVILVGSLLFDRITQDGRKRQETLAQILTPLQERYDNAEAIQSLNENLALDDLLQIQEKLKQEQVKLPEGSTEGKKLAEFASMVANKIKELGGGSTSVSLKVFFDPSRNHDLPDVVVVTHKGGAITAVSKDGKIGILKDDGSISKTTGGGAQNIIGATANETDAFLLGDALYKASKSSGEAEEIGEDTGTITAIDSFGSNVYGLNSKDKSISKFSGSAYAKSSYLTGDAKLSGTPSDLSIDASIWVIGEAGSIQKFTRGAEDAFDVKNLSKPFGQKSKIYTEEDYANVYVLDPKNSRVVTIAKSGEAGKEYKAKELARASSFAVDEVGKKLYIVAGNKIYSQNL